MSEEVEKSYQPFGADDPTPDEQVPVVLNGAPLNELLARVEKTESEEAETSVPEFGPCPPGHIYVFDPEIVHEKLKTRGDKFKWARNSDVAQRTRELLLAHEHLARPYPLASYPTDMSDRWLDLRHRFPNFAEVLDLLENRYSLASLRPDSPVCFPPILLLGDPGVGKTAFSKALCVAIGIEYGEIPMAGITEAFSISGLDLSWSTGGPGRVLEIVSGAGHANPIILLDEIDKCGVGGSGGNPYSPLHILLERHSAMTFQDIAFRMPANMSWVNWVATANDLVAIPQSLVSRFRHFEVPRPTREQMRNVVQSIYSSRCNTVANADLFKESLLPEVIDRLVDLSPREVGLLIEDAMGNAAKKKRKDASELVITPDDIMVPRFSTRRPIGFNCN